jgi:ATP phosphoribosyltransferase
MSDLEEMSIAFRRLHGRRLRVATKYMKLTQRFFAHKGITDYRIVESLGATEGAPAAGLAELIVDITTTGATLKANGLKVLDDGVVLKSRANLVASRAASWTPELAAMEPQLCARFVQSLRQQQGRDAALNSPCS